MAQTKIVGGGVLQAGPELAVDPLYNAARVALRPLDHTNLGAVLGHYRIAATSGLVTGIAAGALVYSMRWAPASTPAYCVLLRLLMQSSLTTAFTAAQVVDYDVIMNRAWTIADTGQTQLTPITGNSQKMRSTNMGTSLMNDLRIAGTAAITAGTRTPDSQPFGFCVAPGNTVVSAVSKGDAAQFASMYAADQPGQGHPVVFAANEGLNIRNITAFGAVGVVKLYVVA